MPDKLSLSVIVITKNEADRIATCLSSVAPVADEIIVFDSGSTDATVDIVKRFTPLVFETDWPGFGVQKQRVLEKATGDWVLSIDADEELSPELREEIGHLMQTNPTEVAFKIPRVARIFGTQLNYGRSARHVKRLFKREGACFSPDIVHEKVKTGKGPVGRLKARLYHYSIRDFEHYLSKNRQYSWLGAKKRYQKGVTGGGLWGASIRAILVFIRIYFFRRGFLDGSVGFLVAVMYSQGAFNKYAGLWTLHRHDRLKQQKASPQIAKRHSVTSNRSE